MMKLSGLLLSLLLMLATLFSMTLFPSSFFAMLYASEDYFLVFVMALVPLTHTFFHLFSRPTQQLLWVSFLFVELILIALGTSGSLNFLLEIIKEPALLRIFFSLIIAFPIGGSFAILFRSINSSKEESEANEFVQSNRDSKNEKNTHFSVFSFTSGVLCAAILPYFYGQFLVNYYSKAAQNALADQRIVKAHQNLLQITSLSPDYPWDSVTASQMESRLQLEIDQLYELLLKSPPPKTPIEIGRTAQALIRLDEFELALKQLAPLLEQPQEIPLAWDTAGLIYQRQEKWNESLNAYQNALRLWEKSDRSRMQGIGKVSAIKGIAFALNKLGKLNQAGAAYEELLQVQATGENYLLAARFFESAQQTKKATQYANKAIAVGNKSTVEDAKRVLNQLTSAHWGCFQAYRSSGR